MKIILISICILLASTVPLAAQTTTKPTGAAALDKCAEQYGFLPCYSALMKQVEKSTAEQLDGGVGKRQQFINEMNERAKVDKVLGRGLMIDWLVIAYGERKTIADLPRQVRDPDNGAGADFAGLKSGLTTLGFKGAIAMTTSGECLVVPFADGAKSRIEKCDEINFLTIDDQGGAGKREQFIQDMNASVIPQGGKAAGGGPMSDWLVMVYPKPIDLVLLRQQLLDATSEQSNTFADKKRILAPLGFKGEITVAASGACIVIPFSDRTKAHIESFKEIDFLQLAD